MPTHVSVLVPVYNVEPYIGDLFEQLKHLSGVARDAEFVFVEDGSSDRSLARLESLLKEADLPNATLIKHGNNRGLSAARNTLIDAAKGTYVWFLDSDDLISVAHAAALFESLREDPTDCLLFDFLKFRENTCPKLTMGDHGLQLAPPDPVHVIEHVTRSLPPNETLSDRDRVLAPYLLDGQHYSWAMIVRRSLLANIRFPEHTIFEDQAVSPRLMLAAKSVRYCPLPIVFYRERENSLMRERTLKAALDVGRAMFCSLPDYEEEGATLTNTERSAFGVCLLRSISWQFGRLERLYEISNPHAQDALRSSVRQFKRFIGDQEPNVIRLMPHSDRKFLARLLSRTSLYLAFRGAEETWFRKKGSIYQRTKRLPAQARGALLKNAPKVRPVLKRWLPAPVFRRTEHTWRKYIYKTP